MEFEYCPLCESTAISKKRGKRTFRLKDNLVITPAIKYWECQTCGEVFYPHETGKKLDELLLAGVGRKAG